MLLLSKPLVKKGAYLVKEYLIGDGVRVIVAVYPDPDFKRRDLIMELRKALEELMSGRCDKIINNSTGTSFIGGNPMTPRFSQDEVISKEWEFNPKKTIVDGWINVYRSHPGCRHSVGMYIFETEQEARANAHSPNNSKQVHIHTEFEA